MHYENRGGVLLFVFHPGYKKFEMSGQQKNMVSQKNKYTLNAEDALYLSSTRTQLMNCILIVTLI